MFVYVKVFELGFLILTLERLLPALDGGIEGLLTTEDPRFLLILLPFYNFFSRLLVLFCLNMLLGGGELALPPAPLVFVGWPDFLTKSGTL